MIVSGVLWSTVTVHNWYMRLRKCQEAGRKTQNFTDTATCLRGSIGCRCLLLFSSLFIFTDMECKRDASTDLIAPPAVVPRANACLASTAPAQASYQEVCMPVSNTRKRIQSLTEIAECPGIGQDQCCSSHCTRKSLSTSCR